MNLWYARLLFSISVNISEFTEYSVVIKKIGICSSLNITKSYWISLLNITDETFNIFYCQNNNNNNNNGHDYFIKKLPYARLSLSLINLRVVQNVEDKVS